MFNPLLCVIRRVFFNSMILSYIVCLYAENVWSFSGSYFVLSSTYNNPHFYREPTLHTLIFRLVNKSIPKITNKKFFFIQIQKKTEIKFTSSLYSKIHWKYWKKYNAQKGVQRFAPAQYNPLTDERYN